MALSRLTSRMSLSLSIVVATVTLACQAAPSVTAPTSLLTASLESDNFSYRLAQGDSVQPARQEAHHAWALQRLGVTVPRRVTYYKYMDRAQLAQATGRATNGIADADRYAIHTLWSWDNHEPTHLYTAAFGRPSDFFNEGIAVALQVDPLAGDFEPRFNGERPHDAVATYRSQGRLPPLDQIVETAGFRAHSDATLVYRQAGSFMLFLLERDGLEQVKAFFRQSGTLDSRTIINERFRATFGRSLAQAEQEWLASLLAP